MRTLITFTLLLAALPAAAQSVDMRRPKMLLATGWDHPDTKRFRDNLAAMEKRPFDGTVIEVSGIEGGKVRRLRPAFAAETWRREWFQASINELRAAKPQRLGDNFILIGANPGNADDVAWYDDVEVVEVK